MKQGNLIFNLYTISTIILASASVMGGIKFFNQAKITNHEISSELQWYGIFCFIIGFWLLLNLLLTYKIFGDKS